MLKDRSHLPVKFTAAFYAAMLGRFVIYGVYGYAVALAFTYAYAHLGMPGGNGAGQAWQSCPWIPFVGIAYLLTIGFFVTRDSLEVNSAKIVDVLSNRALRLRVK